MQYYVQGRHIEVQIVIFGWALAYIEPTEEISFASNKGSESESVHIKQWYCD